MIPFVVVVLTLWLLIIVSVRSIKIRLLVVALPIVAVCAPIASCVMQTELFPVESTEVDVPNSDVAVRLEFWGQSTWETDFGLGRRYLAIRNVTGEIRKRIDDEDWVHWPRMSVYLMEDSRIALLGPALNDYVVDAKNLTIETLRQGTPSDRWTYIGAFDFTDKYKGLRFIPGSAQREYSPTEGIRLSVITRPQGRAERCSQETLLVSTSR